MLKKYLSVFLMFISCVLILLVGCVFASIDRELNSINQSILDLAISYDAMFLNLASLMPGCD